MFSFNDLTRAIDNQKQGAENREHLVKEQYTSHKDYSRKHFYMAQDDYGCTRTHVWCEHMHCCEAQL